MLNLFAKAEEIAYPSVTVCVETYNKQYPSITVQTYVSSGRDTKLQRKVLQFNLKSFICNTV